MADRRAGVSVVLVTAPDGQVAEKLGRALVEERLAACVNIVPGVISLYRWEGSVQKEGEVLMVAKTTTLGFEALRRRVLELHPYEAPEVIALEVRDGDPGYLAWVRDEVGRDS
ncbi:MAG: divalent-cation tolerance protein CutA [Gemmatimonadota bacterium]